MTTRRVMVDITLPRTLLEDEEAFQFVCRGYWEEMVRIAGGTPAEDSMVRGVTVAQDQSLVENEHQVYVHIIGYAEPANFAEDVMRHRHALSVGRYITAEDVAEPLPEMPTYSLSELMAHIGDVARPDYSFGAPWNSTMGTDDYIDGPHVYDYSEDTTGEHWGDAMHWHHEEGKEPL